PVKDNAIYRLAAGLTRLAHFAFPVQLNETTHLYFERMASIAGGQTGADMRAALQTPPDPAALERLSSTPEYNSRLRTTCVATMLAAGHAENALPQLARATVNCRLLPGTNPEEVQQTLAHVIADPQIAISQIKPAKPSPPSPLRPDVFRAIEHASDAVWPGAPVIPVMAAGATDGLYFRKAGIPTYGVAGLFIDLGDDRAHGKDERIRITSFDEAADFLYRLVKSLSS
ncbi:MAG: M20/M25/M40 family metallo-hydrolase, partial [Bryobacteraceae bacterium]